MKSLQCKYYISVLFLLVILLALPASGCQQLTFNTLIPTLPKEGIFTNHGSQYRDLSTYAGIFTQNNKNEMVYYGATRTGTVCHFYLFNTHSRKIEKDMVIPNASGAWAILQHGKSIYIGTYNEAFLYEYNLETEELKQLAKLSNSAYIWDMKAYDNKLYIGTYPEARVFEYSIANNQLTDFGSFSNEKYVRSIEVYDGKIYAGIGARAQFIEFDIQSRNKKDILPTKYSNQSFVYHLKRLGAKIFLGLSPSAGILSYDLVTGEFDELAGNLHDMPVTEKPSFSQYSSIFWLLGRLLEYNSWDDSLLLLENADTYISDVVDTIFVMGVTNDGVYKKFKFDGTIVESIDLTDVGLGGISTLPMSLTAMDNKVYFGGKRLGIYDVLNNHDRYKTVPGEPKSMCFLNGSLFTANYGGASVWRYDAKILQTVEDHNLAAPDFMVLDIEDEQNRPKIIVANPHNSTLLIGTEPNYGVYGGALSYFNVLDKGSYTIRDIVPKHTIYAVTFDQYAPEFAYVGTSVYGGTGTDPLQDDAHIFKWQIKQKRKIFDAVPEHNNKIVTSLAHTGNMLFCTTSNGSLISLNSEDGTVLRRNTDLKFRQVLCSNDGNLYGITKTGLYQIDLHTLAVLPLKSDFHSLYYLTEDVKANSIYFIDAIPKDNQYNLWSYR